ncbi:EF-hand and coiled-coil domain-containing protein 1 [Xenopus tropicalis]|uniref:EF-hand and coiled-coil domain-containing protein 1 n=2 Tax=Xenopus tropicalis TaxID=8364 RepID=A0A8J1JH68_XENTR|nr:EF-hand and coiled-coil domain-containing protein 1 [Xenopus tropicalis]
MGGSLGRGAEPARRAPGAPNYPRLEPCRDDPYSRPARRTQWLLSALAHHYGSDRGVENEIIVLATGLDQYLQEVFHHLDWGAQDSIPGADFRALCQVLGLEPGQIECEGLLGNLPERLTFRQFHARLCGYFSGKAGSDTGRLPSGTDTEHIETQIRLRSPRRRRDPPPRSSLKPGAERSLEQENSNLRELVEDLRAALQSSDARCLALQTAAHEVVARCCANVCISASNLASVVVSTILDASQVCMRPGPPPAPLTWDWPSCFRSCSRSVAHRFTQASETSPWSGWWCLLGESLDGVKWHAVLAMQSVKYAASAIRDSISPPMQSDWAVYPEFSYIAVNGQSMGSLWVYGSQIACEAHMMVGSASGSLDALRVKCGSPNGSSVPTQMPRPEVIYAERRF